MGNFYELFPLKQEKIVSDDERAKTLDTAWGFGPFFSWRGKDDLILVEFTLDGWHFKTIEILIIV